MNQQMVYEEKKTEDELTAQECINLLAHFSKHGWIIGWSVELVRKRLRTLNRKAFQNDSRRRNVEAVVLSA